MLIVDSARTEQATPLEYIHRDGVASLTERSQQSMAPRVLIFITAPLPLLPLPPAHPSPPLPPSPYTHLLPTHPATPTPPTPRARRVAAGVSQGRVGERGTRAPAPAGMAPSSVGAMMWLALWAAGRCVRPLPPLNVPHGRRSAPPATHHPAPPSHPIPQLPRLPHPAPGA